MGNHTFFRRSEAYTARFFSALTIAALLIWSVGPIPFAFAADTGFKAPTATHSPNEWGEGSLGDANGAFTSNNQYAEDNDGGDEQGYSDFNFSIPDGSVINGIEVVVEARSSDSSGCTLEVELDWDGGISGTDDKSQVLTGSDSILTFGGPTDTWGRAWDVIDFSNDNFVVILENRDPGSSCSNGSTVSVDYLEAKVYYTEPEPAVENPPLSNSCGLDIALVMDSSGSISTSELNTMKGAFNTFVSTFLPGTPTLFSVIDFGTNADVLQTLTDDTDLLTTAMNTPTSGGNTNWEQAILDAQASLSTEPPGRASAPNLMVFASDGNPTYANDPGTNVSDDDALAQAITAADASKTAGTHIIALGIGSGVNTANLEAISGSGDVYTVSNFDDLAATLSTLATDLCGGTISVTKVVDEDGNLETTDDQTPGVGFTFDVAGTEQVTDDTGKTAPVEVTGDETVSVVESLFAGYDFVSAMCVVTNDGNAVVGTLGENAVTTIVVGSADIVSCTFFNTPTPVYDGGGDEGGGDTGGGDTGGGDDEENNSGGSGGGSGGGGGPILGGGIISGTGGGLLTPGGQVLGATTDAVSALGETCGLFVDRYMKRGGRNDVEQVKKLQAFLNKNGFGPLPLTGYFGSMTHEAVMKFQTANWQEILSPWVPFGLPTATTPTGYVYKTTLRWINMTECPALNLQLPTLP
mgnify:CR=1 FL=1